MEDSITEKEPSIQETVLCGSCETNTHIGYYKCRSCYAFQYCPDCFREANLIHPGHEFNFVGNPSVINYTESTGVSSSKSPSHCSSCALLAASLPQIRIIYERTQEKVRQMMAEYLEENLGDDMTPEDLKLSDELARQTYKNISNGQSFPKDFGSSKRFPWDKIDQRRRQQWGLDGEKEQNKAGHDEDEKQALTIAEACLDAGAQNIGIFTYQANEKDTTPQQPEKPVIKWGFRISKLVEATQRGCEFCSFLIEKLFGSNWHHLSFYGSSGAENWYSNPKEHTESRENLVSSCMRALTQLRCDLFGFAIRPICSTIQVQLPDYDKLEFQLEAAADDYETISQMFNSRGELRSSKGQILPLVLFEVNVYTTDDDLAAAFIHGRTPNPSPGSERSLSLIKNWASRCSEEHGSSCVQNLGLQAALPRRLIDIGDGQSLKLHECPPGEKGCYTTLSYCWGGSQAFQTSKSTLDAMKSGFSITDLPKTMQHAIKVTSVLGLRYIWIDCLCIIQDDPLDKSFEFSQMGNIYKNSYLTICASRASSVDEGFLLDEADKSTGLWKGLVPLNFHVFGQGPVTANQVSSFPTQRGRIWLLEEEAFWEELRIFATSSRGWCLQEQILSPRFLSYGRWPTWRCRNSTWTDGGYYHSPLGLRDDTNTFETQLVDMIFDVPTSKLDVFRTTQLYQVWHTLIHDYSQREIGRTCDVLPAIGGVAAEISRLTQHRYVAGLWEENILFDLMWFTPVREWSRRPLEWRAPSWSWASVDSAITYDKVTADSKPLATVTRCEIVHKDPLSVFGEVLAGSVEIKGPFSLLQPEDVNQLLAEQSNFPVPPKTNDINEWLPAMLRHLTDSDGANFFNPATRKVDKAPLLQGSVYGLITFSRYWTVGEDGQRMKNTCYSGLFLQQENESLGQFKRVGSFMNETMSWLDQSSKPWKEESIVII